MKRTIKQFVYGFFYLAILSGITFVVYSTWFKTAPSCFNGIKDAGEEGIDCGGVCAKVCLPSTLSPIEAERQFLFRPAPSSVSAMVQVKNANQDFAARNLPYKFVFYDSDGKIVKEVDGESFVYASEIKYIAELNLDFEGANKISTFDFSIGQPEWSPEYLFRKPNLAKQNYRTYISGKEVKVEGSFINNDTVSVPRLTIFAVFYNNLDQPAGISKSEIDDVAPGQQRAFSVSHPLVSNLNLSATEIYLYAN